MNRSIYTATRQSIRDNGMAYTMNHARDTDDTDTLLLCHELLAIIKEDDILATRARWAKSDGSAIAFKLTHF